MRWCMAEIETLSLNISQCTCRLHGTSEGGPAADMPAALSRLSATLRSLCLDYHSAVICEQACSSTGGLAGRPLQVAHPFCNAVFAALPQFQHITQLKLIGFCYDNAFVAAALPPLPPGLRSLVLAPVAPAMDGCGFLVRPSPTHIEGPQSAVPTSFSALGMLRELEELDIGGNALTSQRWGEIVPHRASLPLHTLRIANCGLELAEALPAMLPGTVEAQPPPGSFARLKCLDISGNCISAWQRCEDQMLGKGAAPPSQPIAGLVGRLTALTAGRLTYLDDSVPDWFLGQLADSGALMERFTIGFHNPLNAWSSDQCRNNGTMQACLQSWRGLRVLQLSLPLPVDALLRHVMPALPVLEELVVPYVKSGSNSPYAGAAASAAPPSLTKLVLGRLKISHTGAQEISSWLRSATTLRVLRLRSMKMEGVDPMGGPHTALMHIVTCVGALTGPTELRMHVDCTDNMHVSALAGALQRLRQLERLEFALIFHFKTHWRIPELAEYSLAAALRCLPQRAELRLHDIRLDTDDLREGGMSEATFRALEESLAGLPRLVDVTLHGCLGAAGIEKLQSAAVFGARLQATPASRR